ncbi:MAG: PilZ domain-containing protein [Thermoanaerobaculia bacterium]
MTAPANDGAQLDRRCRPRHRALYLRFHSPMPGEIVNLSECGMAIETVIDLPPGYELTFRLRRKSIILQLRGWIRWCRPARTISTSQGKELRVFHSGVEFDEGTISLVRRSADVLRLSGDAESGIGEGASEGRPG